MRRISDQRLPGRQGRIQRLQDFVDGQAPSGSQRRQMGMDSLIVLGYVVERLLGAEESAVCLKGHG
ncbi:hypothetical protein ACFVV7_34050 [Streptomyces globisporus]|uniref:hypothetical protein n=1 Tax=Streptomyces globisporus TaxID=1908 RepID=UPI0036DB2513